MALTPAFRDYVTAEAWADQYAGDTGDPYAVVEDFGPPAMGGNPFTVRRLVDAEEYADSHDAEIQYTAIPTCQVCGDPQNAGRHTH